MFCFGVTNSSRYWCKAFEATLIMFDRDAMTMAPAVAYRAKVSPREVVWNYPLQKHFFYHHRNFRSMTLYSFTLHRWKFSLFATLFRSAVSEVPFGSAARGVRPPSVRHWAVAMVMPFHDGHVMLCFAIIMSCHIMPCCQAQDVKYKIFGL